MSADDPLISIAAAAKAIGLNRSTLSRQVNLGLVRSHDGKVRLSEVLADRRSKIAARNPATAATLETVVHESAAVRPNLVDLPAQHPTSRLPFERRLQLVVEAAMAGLTWDQCQAEIHAVERKLTNG
ncbi:hypothetical protein [Bradyrhizobium stylosanthis]|uniref:hypothetical protein n=1 Tax=Bradyrhizobium stylosanthis TaxID=1803665 RepID=UPI0007C4EB4F|nr:hypothetical protein [Bradyrhizobium stylosanthis]